MKRINSFLPYAQLYLSLAIVFVTWVIYIPTIKEKLAISEGQLGFALFCASIGALLATPLGKYSCNKFGVGKVAFISLISQAVVALGMFLAFNYYLLCASLLLFGIFTGFLQVSVNSLVTAVEEKKKVTIMSACHGFFSLGALIASSLGTVLLIALKNPFLHICLAGIFAISLQLLFKRKYYNVRNEIKKEASNTKNKGAIKSLMLWGLAIIGLAAMVTEGAIADWSGLFLKEVANVNNDYLGLGYAGFSMSMTIGRLIGDYFSKKFGSLQIVLLGFLLSLIGFAVVLIAQSALSIAGFFIIGAGFSIIVPEVYRLSSKVSGVDASSGIAFIAGISYIGFLTGPVALGFIAEHFDLVSSFTVLSGVIVIGTIVTILIKLKARAKVAAC